jgi:hypothetical protein
MESFVRLAILCTVFALGAIEAHADSSAMRPATKAEILNHLSGATKLQRAANGFSYKPGGTVGYKFTNGGICVLSPGHSADCVAVRTDGKIFLMIDRTGTRQKF